MRSVAPYKPDDKSHEAIRQQLSAIDLLGVPALVCNGAGHIVASNASAQQMIAQGRVAKMSWGRFELYDEAVRGAADAGIARAASDAQAMSILTRIDARANRLAVVEILPMPGASLRDFAAAVLVLCRLPREHSGQAVAMLRARFGLTPAEAEVALRLARAERLQVIADSRQVSAHTVRCQCKVIFAKLGVSSHAELAHKLSGIAG